MKREEDNQYHFEEYRQKVVSEKMANAKLRRQRVLKRAEIGIFFAGLVAASALIVKEVAEKHEENVRMESEIPEEKRGIPFDEERIRQLQGNVEILHPEAFSNNPIQVEEKDQDLDSKNDKRYNSVTFDSGDSKKDRENAKNELIHRGIDPEQAEQMLVKAENKIKSGAPEKLHQDLMKQKEEDLTLTQVFGTGVKKAINDALRINEIIGKNGLSTDELEQIVSKTKREENSKMQEENHIEVAISDRDREYWTLTGNGYHGINPPLDTSTNVWVPTGEQTAYYQVGEDALKSDPIWQQVSFDFSKVIGQVPYEEMIEASKQPFDLVPVYATAQDAIEKHSPIPNSEYYESLIGSKVGVPFVLINGVSAKIENVEELARLQVENLAFPLIRSDKAGGSKTCGYLNGGTIVERLSANLEQELTEKTV